MHKIKFLVFAFLFIFVIGTIQSVHAHGLGTVESDIQFFNDNFFKVNAIHLQIDSVEHSYFKLMDGASDIHFFEDRIHSELLSFRSPAFCVVLVDCHSERFFTKTLVVNNFDELMLAFVIFELKVDLLISPFFLSIKANVRYVVSMFRTTSLLDDHGSLLLAFFDVVHGKSCLFGLSFVCFRNSFLIIIKSGGSRLLINNFFSFQFLTN